MNGQELQRRVRTDTGIATRRRGDGLDVHDVRAFADGDDFRHIDPMSTARTGVTHVRTYSEEVDDSVLLIADFRTPMLWGTRQKLRSVTAAEALMTHCFNALAQGAKVALVAATDGQDFHTTRQRGPRGGAVIAHSLETAHAHALAQAQQTPASCRTLDDIVARSGRLAPRGARLVLATSLDRPGSTLQAVAGELARHGTLQILLIRDALESSPPGCIVPVTSDQDGVVRWVKLEPASHTPDNLIASLQSAGCEFCQPRHSPSSGERDRDAG
jgi:uncharacterized protein (DUF58 family)